ncbi:MAG TPA: DNA helicase RecQ [Gemmataceae bacterium]|nr:DNA helicase RecQ [Gemmataceae bacterium]
MSAAPGPWSLPDLLATIERHWGFRSLRPLQEQAMRAVLDGRDSLVVLPTGGGKSLCYQAPSVLRGDTTVVVSPLISLMKDQVDALQACGVPAIQLDSSQTAAERAACERDIADGALRLVFVSPERLVGTDFYRLLQRLGVRTFAIDEAHCISHWGHDFRQEYRQLDRLRQLFPEASFHAYTATATEQVRRDIIAQLGLRDPEVLVGSFDRPNLTYRVLPRIDLMKQVLEVLDRHKGEAGIIYCLRRADVDELTAALKGHGHHALPYHAGLSAEQRKATQDAFAQEQCDLVVATVAFGMGIDRSNIRFVLHTAMPKSVEHYQQETGRAGRDGLEAECVLLHSGGDFLSWKYIVEKSAAEAGADPAFVRSAVKHLEDMDRYCRGAVCRHRALVQYFGQAYEPESCAACDLCLGDAEEVPDALGVAQKILSCVARVKERFGINHVVGVLRGEDTENIRKWGHDQLSTYRLLAGHTKAAVRNWVYQLIGQGVLVQQGDDYPVLKLNAASWEVMKGQRSVRLLQPVRRAKGEKPEKSKADAASWEGVDSGLFEALRQLRKGLAEARAVPPYVIFSDATLRELARARPSSLEGMRLVYGVGEAKLRDFGERFLQVMDEYCRDHGLSRDNAAPARKAEAPRPSSRPNPMRTLAFDLFRREAVVEDVMHQTGRARSTVVDYLAEFIREQRPGSVAAWVADDVYQQVAAAARKVGTAQLKPIYLALGEQVPYDDIRLVVAHLQAQSEPGTPPA